MKNQLNTIAALLTVILMFSSCSKTNNHTPALKDPIIQESAKGYSSTKDSGTVKLTPDTTRK